MCGPGITHLLQGRPKKVHVQQQRAPSIVAKKKVVAPKSKLMWRRKEAPSADSRHGPRAIVDIPPPFRADPHALRTTLFEGGEDDMVTTKEAMQLGWEEVSAASRAVVPPHPSGSTA